MRMTLLKAGVQYSQNHRITGWSGLEGTSVGHLVQSLPKQDHLQQAAQDLLCLVLSLCHLWQVSSKGQHLS